MKIQFTTQIFKEGRTFVAYTRELDLSSCAGTQQKALQNLKEAVRLFLEEAEKMGTLQQILEEAGYLKRKSKLQGPRFITTRRVSLPMPLPLHHVTA
jgi:predicted RNase H-like HicB family nuclease